MRCVFFSIYKNLIILNNLDNVTQLFQIISTKFDVLRLKDPFYFDRIKSRFLVFFFLFIYTLSIPFYV